ncbi:hypothetical protein LCGC14_1911880, partial [marine sediment metagenome]
DHAQSHNAIGGWFEHQGQYGKALAHYRQSLELAQRTDHGSANASKWLQELSYTNANLCSSYLLQGSNVRRAKMHCRKALIQAERLTKIRPESHTARLDLAIRYAWLADTDIALGNIEDGLNMLKTHIKIIDEIVALEPANRHWQEQQMRSYAGYAMRLAEHEEREISGKYVKLAMTLAEALEAHDPTNEEWSRWLEVEEKLALPTARRRCGYAKQFFRHAVKKRFIERNPFVELKAATYGNREKFRFIDHATIQRIIETCPDGEWRAMVALARYGGLRCPSEILTLTWDAINWHRGRMRVRSPKTEHHEGGAFRDVPLFPELLTYLRELWEEAPKGENRVITRYDYNGQNTNLRTQFQKIIRRAGVEPWPKLWQNLRSTRETELAESFPMHVVCTWIGNSEAVARKILFNKRDPQSAKFYLSILKEPIADYRLARRWKKKEACPVVLLARL